MKKILEVNEMNCNHCIDKIKTFVSECEGVDIINISLDTRTLEVEIDNEVRIRDIVNAIEDSGFSVGAIR